MNWGRSFHIRKYIGLLVKVQRGITKFVSEKWEISYRKRIGATVLLLLVEREERRQDYDPQDSD